MTYQKRPYGLVLSELIIAILIAGLLATVITVQLRGSLNNGAQALALYTTTQKMAANWSRIASSCGATSDVNQSVLIAANNLSVADVFTQGENAIAPKFRNCYRQSSVRPLSEAIQTTTGGKQIQCYNFSLSGGGMAPFIATFTSVPQDLTYMLASKYGDLTAATLLSQDLNSPHIRYWPDTQHNYTVQILVGSPTQLAAAPTIIGTTPTGPAGQPPSPVNSSTPPGSTAPPATLAPPPATPPRPLPPPVQPPTSSASTPSTPASAPTPSTPTPPAPTSPPPVALHIDANTFGPWDRHTGVAIARAGILTVRAGVVANGPICVRRGSVQCSTGIVWN